MTYLFDTSAWIEYFSPSSQSRQSAVEKFIVSEKVTLCGLVVAELIQGMKPDEKETIETAFANAPYVETTRSIYEQGGYLSLNLIRQGATVPLLGCLIAATAMAYDCTLVTADRHFERFPTLKLLLLE